MFTYIYIAIYTIFWGMFINLIYYLKKIEDKRNLESQYEFSIEITNYLIKIQK